MTEITSHDAGCWLDGHFGWHNAYRVIERAQAYGFKITPDEQAAVDRYRADQADGDDEVWELINGQGGLSERATDHLESLAPKGFHFDWDAGELSLLACDQIEGHDPADCEE